MPRTFPEQPVCRRLLGLEGERHCRLGNLAVTRMYEAVLRQRRNLK
jgi:hypothetical protein